MTKKTYQGGEYLSVGGHDIRGSRLDGTLPITLARSRENRTLYDPDKVLVPDSITDVCGRFLAFCIDGYPVLGYHKPESARIADMGTGSGVLLVGIVDGLIVPTDKELAVDAIDANDAAVETTRLNVDISVRETPRPVTVTYKGNDYLEALDGLYNYIYFNPPYLEEGHNITHEEARQAPKSAIFVDNSIQEYERVVPKLSHFLTENGMALIRLPREDKKIDTWMTDYITQNDNVRLLLIQDDKGRQGRILAIVNKYFPDAIGQYDYWENYLGGQERRAKAKSEKIPIYHDHNCEVTLIRQETTIRLLGGRALKNNPTY